MHVRLSCVEVNIIFICLLKRSDCVMGVSGMKIVGLFQLPESVQRSVLHCLVSMTKLDRDLGQVSCFVNYIHVYRPYVYI